ncbi:MAG: hypothetical protein RLZZ511_1159 [Cyanobacteriota bacterium]|jgi:hypothetical protein
MVVTASRSIEQLIDSAQGMNYVRSERDRSRNVIQTSCIRHYQTQNVWIDTICKGKLAESECLGVGVTEKAV